MIPSEITRDFVNRIIKLDKGYYNYNSLLLLFYSSWVFSPVLLLLLLLLLLLQVVVLSVAFANLNKWKENLFHSNVHKILTCDRIEKKRLLLQKQIDFFIDRCGVEQ